MYSRDEVVCSFFNLLFEFCRANKTSDITLADIGFCSSDYSVQNACVHKAFISFENNLWLLLWQYTPYIAITELRDEVCTVICRLAYLTLAD